MPCDGSFCDMNNELKKLSGCPVMSSKFRKQQGRNRVNPLLYQQTWPGLDLRVDAPVRKVRAVATRYKGVGQRHG